MVLVIRMINNVNDNQDNDFRKANYYYFEADEIKSFIDSFLKNLPVGDERLLNAEEIATAMNGKLTLDREVSFDYNANFSSSNWNIKCVIEPSDNRYKGLFFCLITAERINTKRFGGR